MSTMQEFQAIVVALDGMLKLLEELIDRPIEDKDAVDKTRELATDLLNKVQQQLGGAP